MAANAYRPSKVYLPNCQSLREAQALNISELATRAGVNRGLVSSLEQGGAHTTHKVRAVFNALNESYGGSLDPQAEVVPQRFLPRCRTLREDCKMSMAALAKAAGVEQKTIVAFEKHKGGFIQDAEALFDVLDACHRQRHGVSLDRDAEISAAP